MNNKSFELGKYYRHSGGGDLYICGLATPHVYGHGFVGEEPSGEYRIIGMLPENTTGYTEITKEEYLKNFDENNQKIPVPVDEETERHILSKINHSSNDGKYLFAALSILTTSEFNFRNEIINGETKTPDYIFSLLGVAVGDMYSNKKED